MNLTNIPEEEPNQATLDAMKDAENDENMSASFESIAELMKALNS